MRVNFWGTRGSIATPGRATNHFGGNTSCVELETAAGQTLIFDCGTGARPLGAKLAASPTKTGNYSILIGHTHWDHIQGFPFFAPVFIPGTQIDVYAPEGGQKSLQDVLGGQMEFTYFPVELAQLPATINYHELGEGTYDIAGVKVVTQFLNHPATTLGYRVESEQGTIVYLMDHEPFSERLWQSDKEPGHIESMLHEGDRRHAKFMAHADLVIHDAQYTPEEYGAKKNWGHSTFEYVTEVAAAAGVRKLALTHHDPAHDDDFVSEIECRARETAARRGSSIEVFCAYEGCALDIETGEGAYQKTEPPTSAKPTAAQNLLLADDNEELRTLTKRFLEREGFKIREASNGRDALERLSESLPDLLVLDLDMPQMGGLEVLRFIRAQPGAIHVPVLIVTGTEDESSISACFAAGATDYILKPFSTPQLIARVRACLARVAAPRHSPET